MIGLRGMDSIYGDILFGVRGGSYTTAQSAAAPFPFPPPLRSFSQSRFPPLLPSSGHPTPATIGYFSRFLPKINSRFHGRIFGAVFYTAGRNQDDRYARAKSVYRRAGLKTPTRCDRSRRSTVGYEPNAFNKEWIQRIIRCM